MHNIVFSHANGFPALSYSYLFELLAPNYIHHINLFAHGDYKINNNWISLGDELIEFVEKQSKPVIGIGHSMGGVATLYAATKRNDLFSKIILLDPPLVAGSYRKYLLKLAKASGLIGKFFSIAKKTRTRKRDFYSKQEAL